MRLSMPFLSILPFPLLPLLLILHYHPSLSLTLSSSPDPTCSNGLRSFRVCCSPICSKCGGRSCGRGGLTQFCCKKPIYQSNRSCLEVGAPCILPRQTTPSSSPSISSQATATPSTPATPLASPSTTASPSASPSTVPSLSPTATSTPTTSPSPSQSQAESIASDPRCETGIQAGSVCCPKECGTCGGSGCGTRPPGDGACCTGKTKESGLLCTDTLPPCNIVEAPTVELGEYGGRWKMVNVSGEPNKRHEACFVLVKGKGYLIGGRGNKPVDVIDLKRGVWERRDGPGIVLHHMQCVVVGRQVWIVSAWTGSFPNEEAVEDIFVYDTDIDLWERKSGMREGRRRGGAAAVEFGGRIYVVGGNRGGHGQGSETLGWMDYYDIEKGIWVEGLADLPEGRDHVGGGIVGGNRLCIAGGRDGGREDFFAAGVSSVWCYWFDREIWERGDDFAVIRAGAATGGLCDGTLAVVGGESNRGSAWERMDVFDGVEWRRGPDLLQGRHGTGLGVSDCASCGLVFVASGSGGRGGGPELTSTEVFVADGMSDSCEEF